MYKNSFWSKFWDKGSSVIRSDILVNPALISLLGNVNWETILDLWCWNWEITIQLNNKWAKTVGIDSNSEIIPKVKKNDISFLCTDIVDIDFKKSCFDIIYSSMVFLFVNDKELLSIMKKCNKRLKKDWIFVFSDIHPTTEIQKWKSMLVDRKIEKFNYFKTVKTHAKLFNLNWNSTKFDYFHRSLETYIKLTKESWFILDTMVEPKPSPSDIKKYWKYLINEAKNPSYIIFRFIKRKNG